MVSARHVGEVSSRLCWAPKVLESSLFRLLADETGPMRHSQNWAFELLRKSYMACLDDLLNLLVIVCSPLWM